MSRRLFALSYTLIIAVLISSLAFGGEVRKLGSNDLEWGVGTTTSPAGNVVTKIPVGNPSDNSFLGMHDAVAHGMVAGDTSAAVATANTEALQAIATKLKGTDGGTIILPSGDYRLASKVTIYSGTRLVGMGMESTILSGTFSGALIEMMPTTDNVEVAGTWVENLTIDGVSTANGGYGVSVLGGTTPGNSSRQSGLRSVRTINLARGLFVNATQDFTSYDCQFRSSTYGVWYTSNDSVAGVPQQVRFIGCDFRYNTTALSGEHTAGGSTPYMWSFYGCHIESNGIGIVPATRGAFHWTFMDCKFEGNDNEAVILSGLENFRFYGCYFNNNADEAETQQVLIDSSYDTTVTLGGHLFEKCVFEHGDATYDISIQYTRNVKISSCYFNHTSPSIQNLGSDVEITNMYSTILPDPTVGTLRYVSAWITGSDFPYKDIAVIPGKAGVNANIYVHSVNIQVTEAFDNTSGTTGTLSLGLTTSAAYFTQAASVLATGMLTPTFNNQGYTSTNTAYIRATLATDGVLDNTVGKALVFITYAEVPAQP